MGDGEQQEGQIWEAAMEAGHFNLDNLIGIVDRNRLQIDGWVKDVMNVEPLEEKYRSFGWEVITINGHDMRQVVEALEKAKDRMRQADRHHRRYRQGQRRQLSWKTSPDGTARRRMSKSCTRA